MTLVEVLISGALISVVMASVYVLYVAMLDTLSKGELKADLQQNARVGLGQMTQEIRMAGYDPPTGSPPAPVIPQIKLFPKAPLRAATAQCFSFIADVSGDGTADQITYAFDSVTKTLRRRVDNWSGPKDYEFGGGSFQPLAQSIESLTFTYFDVNNVQLKPAAWSSSQRCPPSEGAAVQSLTQLTFEQLAQVRRVAITLKTHGSRPGVTSEAFILTSDVHLRNL
jgi:type II secretory pathway component PulJ